MVATTTTPAHRLNSNLRLSQALEAVPDTDLENDPPSWARWITVAVIILSVLGIVATIMLTRNAADETARADVAEVQRDAADSAAVSLAEQIKAECEAGRLEGAICEEAVDVATVPLSGRDGINGVDGTDGAPGSPGSPGPPGPPGATPPCLSTSTQCQGSNGINGANGANGNPGTDGTSGTNGTNGAAGEQGPKGDPGEPGAPGAPGAPPASFKFTDGTGVEQTCTQDPDSEPSAPTYTCQGTQSTIFPQGMLLRF